MDVSFWKQIFGKHVFRRKYSAMRVETPEIRKKVCERSLENASWVAAAEPRRPSNAAGGLLPPWRAFCDPTSWGWCTFNNWLSGEQRGPWYVVASNFRGVNTPTMANFNLPTWHHPPRKIPENLTISSPKLVWVISSTSLDRLSGSLG